MDPGRVQHAARAAAVTSQLCIVVASCSSGSIRLFQVIRSSIYKPPITVINFKIIGREAIIQGGPRA